MKYFLILAVLLIALLPVLVKLLKSRKRVNKDEIARLEIDLEDEIAKARDLADERIKKLKIAKLAELYTLDELEKKR